MLNTQKHPYAAVTAAEFLLQPNSNQCCQLWEMVKKTYWLNIHTWQMKVSRYFFDTCFPKGGNQIDNYWVVSTEFTHRIFIVDLEVNLTRSNCHSRDFDIIATDKKETTPSKVAPLRENENWTEVTSNLQVHRKFSSV